MTSSIFVLIPTIWQLYNVLSHDDVLLWVSVTLLLPLMMFQQFGLQITPITCMAILKSELVSMLRAGKGNVFQQF